jgi:hydroxypyruvate reductase
VTDSPRALLEGLFRTAVAAAHPASALPPHLPAPPPSGRLVILAAGKAGGSMAAAAERHYLDDLGVPASRLGGLAVTRRGYASPTRLVRVVVPPPRARRRRPGRHPRDARARPFGRPGGLGGGADLRRRLGQLDRTAAGLSLAEKQALTRALLRSGASIGDQHRAQASLRIKGGHLAERIHPARLVTIGISDVAVTTRRDRLRVRPSPIRPLADARAVVERYRLDVPQLVTGAQRPANETPKPGDAVLPRLVRLAVQPADVFAAVEKAVRTLGYESVLLGTQVEGEARAVAASQARLAHDLQAQGRRAIILSGGELTVTLRGRSRGGPNQEYALALALATADAKGIAALAADTDGTDGGSGAPEDPAGACGRHHARARRPAWPRSGRLSC